MKFLLFSKWLASYIRDTKKAIENGKKQKTKSIRMFNNVATGINFLLLLFLYWKGHILLENMIQENVVYTITFLVKLQDIWNEVMKHQRPYRSALVLYTSYLDPKYLAIDQVYSLAMDYSDDSDGMFFQISEKFFH